MDITSQLELFNLTKKESNVYLALLELGPSSILRISKKTRITRTTVYHLIDNLIEKQFVTISVSGKRKIYLAEQPETIKHILKQRLKSFESLLPELISLTNRDAIKPKITYNEGIKGIKQAYRESLKAKEDTIVAIVGVESLQQKDKALLSFWEKEYIPARKKNNKFGKLVIPDNKLGMEFKKRDTSSFRESRLLPDSSYNFECEILCYDNTVTMISYHRNEEFSLTITSKPIANTFKMLWNIAWVSARK